MTRRALVGADIFDGTALHTGKALLLDGDAFAGIVPADAIPGEYGVERVDGGTLLPGFVDLQVNGGGGVMFNQATDLDGLATIAAAHATTGTRALLPTLITDTPDRNRAAIDAVAEAVARGIPGIVGLHLEGPHLSLARKGAHDPALIRPMEDADEAALLDAARRLPTLMVTLAPESVAPDRIARLAAAGIVVSLGHTDCTMAEARAAFAAGARCVTHLFNAMSQMGSRAPGLVGAALDAGEVAAGLIADGIHVDATAMRIALAAKRGPGTIFLVTDAMATAGTEIDGFELNGRLVSRADGRLTLADGTLAGADLDIPRAISVLVDDVGCSRAQAYAMATSIPAALLRGVPGLGHFVPGAPARAIHMDRDHRKARPA
ncbi:MAG: N-acetylglucosamine-6-phosphate deacetylase [Pseudomonadota bacterium]